MGVSKSIKPDLIPEDCIRVGNKLYNAEKIESWHPGGRLFIQAFTGHDATTTFVQHHRKRFPHKKTEVQEAFVREDPSVSSKVEEGIEEFLELSERVAKVMKKRMGMII